MGNPFHRQKKADAIDKTNAGGKIWKGAKDLPVRG